MPSPSPGYAITMRVTAPAGFSATSELAAAAASVGAEITALDMIESTHQSVVVNSPVTPRAKSTGSGLRQRSTRLMGSRSGK